MNRIYREKDILNELREIKQNYSSVVESNIKLQDERNWAIDDFKRANRKIERALNILEQPSKDNLKEELYKALTEDFYDE